MKVNKEMYQTIVDIATGEITPYDDVVRDWRHMKQVKKVVALLEQYGDVIPTECILTLLKEAIEEPSR